MTNILLKIETGNWDGGHHGQFPKIYEWDLDDLERPIVQSDGWGHGYGGCSFSVEEFAKRNGLSKLKGIESDWAYTILKNALENNLGNVDISEKLVSAAPHHKIGIEENVKAILGARARWSNA